MIKTGLVFGKFLPLHKGHLALIDFALGQCEKVIVSMSFTPQDPISPDIRFAWLQQIFGENPRVELALEPDDFHNPALPLFEATALWAVFIKKRFPNIKAFFCSENYGQPLAQHLGIPCVLFDINREKFPISATQIRQKPFKYWAFIPTVVRPFFVKKVCLFGPESVGKSTLSRQLATFYDTQFVHEVARDVVTSNDFDINDIIKIGHAQQQAIHHKTLIANKLLFCDTDLITTQIYSEYYLQQIPPVLYDLEKACNFDQYFLLNIDVPWVADGLRDLGHKRQEMYQIFKQALLNRNINFIDVSGDWQTRQNIVKATIDTWFS